MVVGALYAIGSASDVREFVHRNGISLPFGETVPELYALPSVAALVALNVLSTEASGGADTAITPLKIAVLGVFVAVGTLGAGPPATAGESAIARAAKGFMPSLPVLGTGASLIVFWAVFSAVSALNAVVIGSSRVAFAMERERQLPGRLGRLHHRYGTPFVAIPASAAVMLVAVPVVPIRTVGNLANPFSLRGFVVSPTVIRLRRRQPNLRCPFEIPCYRVPAPRDRLRLAARAVRRPLLVAAGRRLAGRRYRLYLLPERRGAERSPATAAEPSDASTSRTRNRSTGANDIHDATTRTTGPARRHRRRRDGRSPCHPPARRPRARDRTDRIRPTPRGTPRRGVRGDGHRG